MSVASAAFGIAGPYSWSPDAKVLLWDGVGGVAQLTLSADGTAEHGPLLNEPYGEAWPSFSPDGRWFAYATNEASRWDVYVQPYPMGSGPKRRITIEGGSHPTWRSELFYLSNRQLWAVELATEPTLSWEDPVPLFETPWPMTAGGSFANFDVAANGLRFVFIQPTGDETDQRLPQRRITIVLNWVEELKRLVPTN